MRIKFSVSWRNLGKAVILLSLMFVFSSTWVTSQASNQQLTIPNDYTIEIVRAGVYLYKDTSTGTKFVQVVKLDKGATVRLLHGTIANPGTGYGPYGGNNPSFWRQTIQEAWSEFLASDNNAFCISNGQFFSPEIDPTTLAFSLKKDGVIVSDGYAVAGPKEEYPNQKLMLEIWGNRADIVPLTRDNLYNSDAPNIIAGLTEEANKRPLNLVGRTFVGIDDANNDGMYEVVLVFTSSSDTQASAASVLRNFGADKIIMLDGGGSTQLICNGELYVSSSDNPDRKIPQTLAVSYARNTPDTIDVALIIDSSGSMSRNDPTNQRLGAARVYLSASQPGDRVAIVDFDSYVRLASGLLPALVGGQRNQDLVNAINSIDSYGSTNIRGGIEMACQELIDHGQASRRGAILLTDGEHNVGPFGNPQQCFADRGWPIFTFGFGSANVTLLQQVASQTGGEFKHINNVSSLACEFQRVRAIIAGVQPQPCSVHHIDPFVDIQFLALVPAGQSQATFSTSWFGSDIVMSLTSPSGRVIDRSTVALDVIHDLGPNFEVYTILNPEPGDWSVNLYGADVPPGGEDVVFGFTTMPLSNQSPALLIPGDQSSQYSDQLSLTITASDPNDPPDTLVFSSTILPNGLNLTDNGNGTATISGIVNVNPGFYDFEITVTDPGGLSDTKSITITVTQEDARLTYTGPMLVSTVCATCSTATVPLRAMIQDISAVMDDPAYDAYPGDITHATVTFVDRGKGNVPLCTAMMTLLDPTNSTLASVACDWKPNIGTAQGMDYTIGIVVNGYYVRDSVADDTVVVVSKPGTNFITGGGYLTNKSSAGKFAGDTGEKTNFGLNIKFNKSLTNLQGKVTIIVRQGGRVYQVKTNALTSLVVVPYDAKKSSSGTAELLAKANVIDVTDPLNPIALTSSATLQLKMKDNGEPGSTDVLSITLWSKDGMLLFSINWNGVKTLDQILDGGNLAVH